MILDYLKERYDFINPEVILDQWSDYLERLEARCYMTTYGFVTYGLKGDAVLIYDMFVKPKYREQKYAWKLHDYVLKHALREGKRVALTFCDIMGKNHMLGVKAMKAAGFIPAYHTKQDFVFIKGI